MLGLYRDNGKENGNYYSVRPSNTTLNCQLQMQTGCIFRLLSFRNFGQEGKSKNATTTGFFRTGTNPYITPIIPVVSILFSIIPV